MGLLDDLRNQADSQRASEEEEANRKANREQYYLDKIQPRLIKTYQFFNELVEHLNYIKMETIVNYPFQPGGAPQPLRQGGYKVVIDSSKAIKKIDFSMEGVLDEPVEFEVFGRDAVSNHSDRIKQYAFRHECKVRKDAEQYIQSAKFILEGPLPLKVTVEADIPASRIKVTIRNFIEPGFSSKALTVEEFNDEFLDKIGKFVLRKEPILFGSAEELSEEAKKQLRDRMIVEARIRQQELIEAEAHRKAEETAELEKSAKEQIKRVVNTKVAKGKESLKDMFSKLKKQAGFEATSGQPQVPAPTTTPATTQQAPLSPAAPAPTKPQVPLPPAASAPTKQQAKQQAPMPPAAPAPTKQEAPMPPAAPAPTKQEAPMPPAVPAQMKPQAPVPQAGTEQQRPTTPKPKVLNENSTEPSSDPPLSPNPFLTFGRSIGQKVKEVAVSTDKKNSSAQEYVMPATVKTATPNPKRHVSSSVPPKANPFLKAEELEDVTTSTTETGDSDNQGKPVLKPGELNTDLVKDLKKSQTGPDQKNQQDQQEEGKPPTPSVAPTSATENPFMQTGGLKPGLSTTSSPTSTTPNQSPLLKPTEQKVGAHENLTSPQEKQNKQKLTSENKPSLEPPVSTESTQKPALQQAPPLQTPKAQKPTAQKSPVQKSTVQKSTQQKPSEADLSLNARELSVEDVKQDVVSSATRETSVTTQDSVSVKEPAKQDSTKQKTMEITPKGDKPKEHMNSEADLTADAGKPSLEETKEKVVATDTNELLVTTENPALEQELIDAEKALMAAHKSLEEVTDDLPPSVSNESAVTKGNPELNLEESKDLTIDQGIVEKNQDPSPESMSSKPKTNSTEDPSLELDEIDIDLSVNFSPSQDGKDPEEKS